MLGHAADKRYSLAVMTTPIEPLEFSVQGSAAEPYLVRFWREGANLRSSCTCQAGRRGLACKHRLSLLAGDVTNLVDSATSTVLQLRQFATGTDVDTALSVYERLEVAPNIGTTLLPLKPPFRRKTVATEAAALTLAAGGLAKGNTSYFDIYSSTFQYIGSVKVRRGTVFSEKVEDYFPGVGLTIKRITDGLSWERSQSVYAAMPSSSVGRFLTNDEAQSGALRKLKNAVVD